MLISNLKLIACSLIAGVALALSPSAADAQGKFAPTKQVHIIVGYTPGGSTDAIARQVGNALSKLWGQPVIIENKPGSGANLGADMVAKANPDGYTLLMWHDGLAANASLYKQLTYDPIKDLAAVAPVARVSIVMGVASNFPGKTVKEVIEMTKAKPGAYSYASCGPGTPHHIAGEMFKSYVQLDVVHVAYKGCAPALTDIIGGHIPIFFQTLSNVTDHMKNNRLRVLAVADEKRVADYPDLPTMVEAGVPNFVMSPWYGIFAPGNTPKAIVDAINADIVSVVNGEELNSLLKKSQYQPMTSTPEQFSALVKTDIQRLGEVIKKAKMTAD